ncbi:gelsolin-like protein 2 [Halichondria panicea]|uniref:gelsolin-like protein 2 n=1 Tax=Halichondria panicea TaxID=6063 RepID=UPI00312B5DCD
MASGLVKAKKYDWQDSNLALFGSDTEKQVKKESAETEPAWKGAGEKVGIQIWRIVKFKVKHWPKDDYGKFYNGDSYIILNTYKEPENEALLYDVHFWIGQYSTQDEYGTAAYKTVELDTLLDDKPVQHREVQDNESDMFKGYFPTVTILNGGADTGFKHVVPVEYKPRLLHFHGERKRIEVKEKEALRSNLDSTDVFILDLGLELYQWNGSTCNKDEKFKAVQYTQKIKTERSGKPKVEVLEERDVTPNHKFYSSLSDGTAEKEPEEDDSDFVKSLLRLSDASGELEMKLEGTGSLPRSKLDPKDVFILDTGKALFVWTGNETSSAEQRNALSYAHNYLMKTKHPKIPVTCYRQSATPDSFYKELEA